MSNVHAYKGRDSSHPFSVSVRDEHGYWKAGRQGFMRLQDALRWGSAHRGVARNPSAVRHQEKLEERKRNE